MAFRRSRLTGLPVAVCVAASLTAARAHADIPDVLPPGEAPADDTSSLPADAPSNALALDPPDAPRRPHYWNAAWEAAVVIAIPAAYYWSTQKAQEVDWTLDWDWKSWKQKIITFHAVRFDTNPFHVNAIRHPLTGAIDYQVGRSNGFGMLGSELLAVGTGIFWEYFVEFHEDPAINDMLMNSIGGLAVGEPLWQIGQLWRGGDMSWSDYAASTLFSPFDTFHRITRGWHPWWRPKAWHAFKFIGGAERTQVDGQFERHDAIVGADLEVIRHPAYFIEGAHTERIEAGAWSRVTATLKLGETGSEDGVQGALFHSRTSIYGHYWQNDDGVGVYYGMGTAFTYNRERLPQEWDRVALGHLVGPQLELSIRRPGYTVRWELAAYVDFALMQAHVFGLESPFPPPPPLLSTLQANGYYFGGGASLMSRLRFATGPWDVDLEASGHAVSSLDFADRVDLGNQPRSTVPEIEPDGVDDQRVYWRAAVGFRPLGDRVGITLSEDGVVRRGTWQSRERESTERTTLLAAALYY
jgi:hypothetical protein